MKTVVEVQFDSDTNEVIRTRTVNVSSFKKYKEKLIDKGFFRYKGRVFTPTDLDSFVIEESGDIIELLYCDEHNDRNVRQVSFECKPQESYYEQIQSKLNTDNLNYTLNGAIVQHMRAYGGWYIDPAKVYEIWVNIITDNIHYKDVFYAVEELINVYDFKDEMKQLIQKKHQAMGRKPPSQSQIEYYKVLCDRHKEEQKKIFYMKDIALEINRLVKKKVEQDIGVE